MLKDPWADHSNLGQGINAERRIVRRELAQRHNSDLYKQMAWRNGIIFDPHSVIGLGRYAGGTNAGLKNIMHKDLRDLAPKIFVPDQTLVSVFTEGERGTRSEIHQRLADQFADFPNEQQKSMGIDLSKHDVLHPKFKADGVYVGEFGRNKLVRQVDFIWQVANNPFTPERAAHIQVQGILDQAMNRFVRAQGISYEATVSDKIYHNRTFCVASFQVENQDDIAYHVQYDLVPSLQRAWSAISPRHIARVNNNEKVKQLATPLPVEQRFQEAMASIKDYGVLVDSDKLKAVYTQMTAEDLSAQRDFFVNSQPAIFIY